MTADITTVDEAKYAAANVDTPEMASHCLSLSAYAVVVEGAITCRLHITRRFSALLKRLASDHIKRLFPFWIKPLTD